MNGLYEDAAHYDLVAPREFNERSWRQVCVPRHHEAGLVAVGRHAKPLTYTEPFCGPGCWFAR